MSLYNHIKNRAQMNACDVAIEFEENKITYEELIKQSEELYCRISKYCIFDEAVIVALPRSGDIIIAMMAVLRTNSFFLVLDLLYPYDRIYEIVQMTPSKVNFIYVQDENMEC